MHLLEVSGISRKHGGDFILRDISFTQERFQKIAIAGETGSGKTSLLKIIAGLMQPDAGKVLYQSLKVAGPADKLIPGHPSIAYLSQQFELPQQLRVEQVLEYANTLPDKSAADLFHICQIDHLMKRKTHQLSGGERQRIALAKLLISSPGLLLLDEPFSNLDSIHTNTLKSTIRRVCEELNTTCIMISHSPEDILPWADQIIVMRNGTVVQMDIPFRIYHQPVNEYVAALFGDYYFLTSSQFAFFESQAAQLKDARYFVRPEYFQVLPETVSATKAEVIEAVFSGPYYELSVKGGFGIIRIRTVQPFSKGDFVQLRLNADRVWAI